jgi:hypothetical protein
MESVAGAALRGKVGDAIQTVTDSEDLVGEDAKLGTVAARVSTRGDRRHDAYEPIRCSKM